MNWHFGIKATLGLTIVAFCLFEFMLHRQSEMFREFEAAFLSLQWTLLVCLGIWCGTFLLLSFSLNDLPLIGLLLIAIAAYFIVAHAGTDAITLLAGVTLGRGARFALEEDGRWNREDGKNNAAHVTRHTSLGTFLVGLVGLLALASWWHLDMSDNFYHGPRWMGLWNNPNLYGMLMGAGVVLAIGLLAERLKAKGQRLKAKDGSQQPEIRSQNWFLRSLRSFAAIQSVFLFIAAGMMAVGLVMSYSRGSWLGTAIGFLYLAWSYGKLKWRYVVIGVGCVALGAGLLWGRTADSAPWYVKRMDLGRPSAQHRVAAWRGALQMMRDHPLGVSWNNAITIYEKNYSPPENGAAAITTNDYLMLGTQLGWPGLICFVAYAGLALVGKAESGKRKAEIPSLVTGHSSLRVACRAGALTLLVAFWFDGGLFTLATAAVFWILLELSQVRSAECGVARESKWN